MWFPTHSPLSALCYHAVDTAELDSDYSWTGDPDRTETNQPTNFNNVSTVIIAFLFFFPPSVMRTVLHSQFPL
jgi:hypothetical protein